MVDFNFAMFSTNSNEQGLQFLSNSDTITREFFNNYVVGFRPFYSYSQSTLKVANLIYSICGHSQCQLTNFLLTNSTCYSKVSPKGKSLF
jgi:hypothetical protein